MVNQYSHYIFAAGKHDEGNDCERQAEAKHNLTKHESACRVESERNNDERRSHGNNTPYPRWDGSMNKALHNDLPSHGADCGR